MLRKIFGALLACATFSAYANEQTWQFTYQGFQEYPVGVFLPQHILRGTFKGTDLNNDGTLVASELSSLFIGGEYVGCTTVNGPESSTSCSLLSFTFTPSTGTLAFETRWSFEGWDPPRGQSRSIVTGVHDEYWIMPPGSNLYFYGFAFTPATTLELSNLTPIPEPASWAMLAAGLLTISATRRRTC